VTEAVYPHCGYRPGHQDIATTIIPTTPPVLVQRHEQEKKNRERKGVSHK